MSIQHLESPNPVGRKSLPLRLWAAWIAASYAILTLLVTGALTWFNGQQAVTDLASDMQRRASEQVSEHLRAYLASPIHVIRMMSHAIETGAVDPKRPDTLYQYLWRLAGIFDGVSYLNYGFEDGHFYGLGRVTPDSPELHIEEAGPPDISKLYQYPLDEKGQRQALKNVLPFGDFHQQVWYAQPLAKQRLVWTDIYNWEDNPAVVVVGAGQALLDANGKAIGVAEVDLFLGEISHFLAKLDVSPNARTFIIDRQGRFVATSSQHPIFRQSGKGQERILASESGDEIIRSAAAHLQQRAGGLAGIDRSLTERIRWKSDDHYLRVTPWSDPYGLDWLIVVTVPEADFAKTVYLNNRNTILLMSLLLLLGVGAFIWLAGIVTRPIRRLEQSAQQVIRHQLQNSVPGSFFSEFNQLAASFNRMVGQLQTSLRMTEQAQNRLEEEVIQRTEELRRANAELEMLSQHDSLTHLANRRRFDPAFETEWYRAQRNHSPLALVMCDIDYFKKYNDLYGHLKGDDALRQIADCLAAAVTRAGDLVARFGGEEFAILLPGTTLEGAMQVVENVRLAVLERAIEHSGNTTGLLTISFGIALMDGDHPSLRPKHLLAEADKALYAAKAAGRNRIEIAGVTPNEA